MCRFEYLDTLLGKFNYLHQPYMLPENLIMILPAILIKQKKIFAFINQKILLDDAAKELKEMTIIHAVKSHIEKFLPIFFPSITNSFSVILIIL